MGKEMRDMIKKENKLCFQHRMERKTEKSFQLSAGRQRLLAETIRELKQEGRLDEEKLAMQHGTTSIYRHSLNVAYTSLWMMERWQKLRTLCAATGILKVEMLPGAERKYDLWQEKETKAESQVHSALKMTYYEAFSEARKALNSEEKTGSVGENIILQDNFDMKA